ncbi:MAG: hypothetical protein GOV00_00400 [Candidatus Altiarchaeota archaeon]|nr:hypothetical protein [Candidatus Altiarchaeota archaeon]
MVKVDWDKGRKVESSERSEFEGEQIKIIEMDGVKNIAILGMSDRITGEYGPERPFRIVQAIIKKGNRMVVFTCGGQVLLKQLEAEAENGYPFILENGIKKAKGKKNMYWTI